MTVNLKKLKAGQTVWVVFQHTRWNPTDSKSVTTPWGSQATTHLHIVPLLVTGRVYVSEGLETLPVAYRNKNMMGYGVHPRVIKDGERYGLTTFPVLTAPHVYATYRQALRAAVLEVEQGHYLASTVKYMDGTTPVKELVSPKLSWPEHSKILGRKALGHTCYDFSNILRNWPHKESLVDLRWLTDKEPTIGDMREYHRPLHEANTLASRGFGKTMMMEKFITKLEGEGAKVIRHRPTFEEKIRNLERPLPADVAIAFYDPTAHTRLNADVIIKRGKERPPGSIPVEFSFDYKFHDALPEKATWADQFVHDSGVNAMEQEVWDQTHAKNIEMEGTNEPGDPDPDVEQRGPDQD